MKKIIFAIGIISIVGIVVFCKNYLKKERLDIVDNFQVVNMQADIINEAPISDIGVFQEKMQEIIDKYPDFARVIYRGDMEIPISNDMVPQGITLMDEHILITAYDSESKNNSVVYVLDKRGHLINTVNLDTKSHVGGVAYDQKNKLIWLPGNNGVLLAYASEDFIKLKQAKAKYKFTNVSEDLMDFLDENKKLIAFLTVDEDNIYIGNFSKEENSIVKKYKIINNNDKVKLKYVMSFKVPAKTQSITFFKKENKKYMIMSNSYTRRKSSYLQVYEYDERVKVYNKELTSVELPPMLEQVVVNGNSLYTIFESNAKKYSNCLEKIGYICILDIYKLLNAS